MKIALCDISPTIQAADQIFVSVPPFFLPLFDDRWKCNSQSTYLYATDTVTFCCKTAYGFLY